VVGNGFEHLDGRHYSIEKYILKKIKTVRLASASLRIEYHTDLADLLDIRVRMVNAFKAHPFRRRGSRVAQF